jgi:CTP:molybdopterin cytidylyltransferase MocA
MKFRVAESVDAQSKIGIVILAAGASVLMGRPKQLLPQMTVRVNKRAARVFIVVA